jgi:dienelactone hydrolase
MIEERVVLQNKGMKLVGVVSRPDRQPLACLVLFHGFGGWKDETNELFVRTSRSATEQGFACARFDFRYSKTERNGSESDGGLNQMSPSEWISDARLIVAHCRQRFPGLKVGAVGLSMGGLVLCNIAAEGIVDAMAAWSAPMTLEQEQHNEEVVANLRKSMGPSFDAFLEDVRRHSPAKAAPKIGVPVLAVAGEKDAMVPPSDAKLLFDSVPGKKSMLMIGGADHVFSSNQAEVIAMTLSWFRLQFST